MLTVHECFCGCATFKILATFDDYELTTYSTEMYCSECGAKYKTPCEIDRPDFDPGTDHYVTV